MKKFIVISIVVLMIAGFVITSSADEITLWAGQNIEVGTLTVESDGTNLVVTYAITAQCWVLGETHLYAGRDRPTKSAPGQFPYGPDDAVDGVYTIPLADLDLGERVIIFIAAHAEVTSCEQGEETAWADGCEIRPGKNWAMYFKFDL